MDTEVLAVHSTHLSVSILIIVMEKEMLPI
jgi:hypothetical protein